MPVDGAASATDGAAHRQRAQPPRRQPPRARPAQRNHLATAKTAQEKSQGQTAPGRTKSSTARKAEPKIDPHSPFAVLASLKLEMTEAAATARASAGPWLWCAFFNRSLATKLLEAGRLRQGGQVVSKSHQVVQVGDVLTFRKAHISASSRWRRWPAAAAQRRKRKRFTVTWRRLTRPRSAMPRRRCRRHAHQAAAGRPNASGA